MKEAASINLALDRSDAELIAAFRAVPTARRVMRAICDPEDSAARVVIGAYGTGKSYAALAALELLDGTVAARKGLVEQLGDDGDLAALGRARPALTVCLVGTVTEPLAEIARQAGIERPIPNAATLCEALTERMKALGAKRCAIVWDEFGAQLDNLARSGRTEALLDLQTLAEWTVRQRSRIVTLTLLMHRPAAAYAPAGEATEAAVWRKIEGRFRTLALSAEDPETIRLVVDAMPRSDARPDEKIAKTVRTLGFFEGFDDPAALADILARAQPLTPAALDALPRLCARLGQNTRTALRLATAAGDGGGKIGIEDLFDALAPDMRGDTSPGGSLRELLRAEATLARCESEEERAAVKALAILGMGDKPVSRARLLGALTMGGTLSPAGAGLALDALTERRVMLDRPRRGEVMLWRGGETDTAALIAIEAARVLPDGEALCEALTRLFPAEPQSSTRYTLNRGVRRYARASYVTLDALADAIDEAGDEGGDAALLLVIDAGDDAVADRLAPLDPPAHVVVAALPSPPDIAGPLREAAAIEVLRKRETLHEEDALLAPELDALADDALAALWQVLEPLIEADRGQVVWFADGVCYAFAEGGSKEQVLNALFERRFPLTPSIQSETVVRHRVTAITRSARRRCLLGVIERNGTPALGYEEATSADASIYRTVFERTGLYGETARAWVWRESDDVDDPGLATAWRAIRDFLTVPEDAPKPLTALVETLGSEPFGIRAGVLPLLVGAGMLAFARGASLREKAGAGWRYVDDVTPSLVERLCEEPEAFALAVPMLDDEERERVRALASTFGDSREAAREADPVRALYDAMLVWRDALPAAALTARGIGAEAAVLQGILRGEAFDPLDLMTRILPEATGETGVSEAAVAFLERARERMEAVVQVYEVQAAEAALAAFGGGECGGGEGVARAAQAWAEALPDGIERAPDLDLECRGILNRARGAMAGGDEALTAALSGILFGTGFEEWTDRSGEEFARRLDTTVKRIEEFAFRSADGSDRYAPFVRRRFSATLALYRAALGEDAFRAQIEQELETTP